MDHKKVEEYWEDNAENWTKLARLGYDKCRDLVNSPAFFKILPAITGLTGLDLGCGEGYNTRIAAKKGAKMDAIDIAPTFIQFAKDQENSLSLGIHYQIANANNLPFLAEYFDFVMATMSLMDMYELPKVLDEVYRVLKKGGFFQFSITHPCFNKFQWLRDETDKKTSAIVQDYFNRDQGEIEEWIFRSAPKEMTKNMKLFKIPRFDRTLAQWLNLLLEKKFTLEHFWEPHIEDELLKQYPGEYDSRIIPLFLIIRCRK